MRVLFALTAALAICDAYNYRFILDEKMMPCDNGLPFIDQFMDISSWKFISSDDAQITLIGNMTVLADFDPKAKVQVTTQLYKKQRGSYVRFLPVPHIITDFCKIEFDSSYFWYPVTKTLEGVERQCPPPKGTVMKFRDVQFADSIQIPHKMSGEYKAESSWTIGKMKACYTIVVEVEEI